MSGVNPISGITVSAYDSQGFWYMSTFTQTNGTYSIQVVPGTYTLGFADGTGGFAGCAYTSTGPLHCTQDIRAASSIAVTTADVPNIDVALQRNHQIRGRGK